MVEVWPVFWQEEEEEEERYFYLRVKLEIMS